MSHLVGRKGVGLSIAGVLVCVALFSSVVRHPATGLESQAEGKENSRATSGLVRVDVVKPLLGGMDRNSVQPGSIHAYESAELFAKISGYLQRLYVDIGDRVKAGQLLAEIDAPELLRDVDRAKAAVTRAKAQVGQMRARLVSAQADLNAAQSGVPRAEAGVKRDSAAYEFRDKQYRRFKELVDAKSVDERLVDEKEDQRLSARAAVDAAESNLVEAKAFVASAAAKVEQAKADLVDAEAEVEVAEANLAKSQVFADYTRIISPYDGVVTYRGFHRGAFVRAADQGTTVPLLNVERTDVVRLVVYMPDPDVPFTDPGDDTVTEIDALPGRKFEGKISRIGFSEDMKTKTMRTEIDLPNEQGVLRNGMYGRTTLILQKGNPKAFLVPSSAMIGGTRGGKGTLYIVHDGVAKKTPVSVGTDNGIKVEILDGISAEDFVVVGNNNDLADGRKVEAHELPVQTAKP